MCECKQCPYVVGDSYQRDCAFPDCVGGWEEAHRSLATQLSVSEKSNEKLKELVDAKNEQLVDYVSDLNVNEKREKELYEVLKKAANLIEAAELMNCSLYREDIIDIDNILTGSKPIQGEKLDE